MSPELIVALEGAVIMALSLAMIILGKAQTARLSATLQRLEALEKRKEEWVNIAFGLARLMVHSPKAPFSQMTLMDGDDPAIFVINGDGEEWALLPNGEWRQSSYLEQAREQYVLLARNTYRLGAGE